MDGGKNLAVNKENHIKSLLKKIYDKSYQKEKFLQKKIVEDLNIL
jgi:hypothetical protein